MRVVIALFSAALFLPATPVVGQSSETDEKETETKTYTSYDLRRAGGARRTAPPSVPANPSQATANDQAVAESTDPEQEEAAAAEEAWREELAAAEAAVAQLEQQIVDLEPTLGDQRKVGLGGGWEVAGGVRRGVVAQLARTREELVEAEARVEELVQDGYGSGYVR